MIEKPGATCVCVHLCPFMFLCVFSDREQGLGSPSNEGGGSEKSVQDSFFLIWYGGRGGEAAVLFFLALALTTLSGY